MTALSLKQGFLRPLGGSIGIYFFGTAMAFLVGIQLARGLGVAGYGLYGSAMAAASLGATFAAGGLQLHATRDLSAYRAQDDHESAASLVDWSFRKVLLLGAAAALVVGAYGVWGLKAPPAFAISTMIVTALIALLSLSGAIVRGAGQLVLGQALDTAIRPAAQSGLLLIALLAWGPLEPGLAMILTVVAICLTLPFGWRTIAHIWRVPRAGFADEAQRSAWSRSSATMGLTTAINAAEAAIPLILVGALSTMEQAGIFRVATAMMVFTNLPSTMISVMVPAMASSLYQRQEMAQLARLSLAASFVMFFPTLAIAGCLWMFGDNLLGLAFGNEYRAAWPILSVLAGASVVNAISGISISLLHASRHDAVVTKACGLSLAVTCIGLFVAAFSGGAAGFAMAVFAGLLARTVFLALSTYHHVGIDPTILAAVTRIFRRLRGEQSS